MAEWVWPMPEHGDHVMEPHEVGGWLEEIWRKRYGDEFVDKLLADKEAWREGERYVIRPVIRLRRIPAGLWENPARRGGK